MDEYQFITSTSTMSNSHVYFDPDSIEQYNGSSILLNNSFYTAQNMSILLSDIFQLNLTGSTTNMNDNIISRNHDTSIEPADSIPSTTLSIPFDFLINGIGITVVASLGIIGNILSGIVLSRPQMKSSVTCLLLGLAFCDTLLISISILIFGLLSISEFTKGLKLYRLVYYPLWVPYLFPISITAQTGSVYLTLAVTIERYVAVCHPLRARSLCTWRRAVICVFTVLTMSAIYNLPRWFEVCTHDAGPLVELGNATSYGVTMCPMRDSSVYKVVYINWMYFIVMYLVPFTGLVVFNWAIYRQVRKANRERAVMSKLQRRELGLATMLLFVVGVFLLCNVLPLVNNILESFYDTSIDQLVQFSNFLVILNSSVNFVIYCTCGERFRRLLLRLCHDCLLCRLMGGNQRKNSLHRKPNLCRGRQGGGDFEEVSMTNTHTCASHTGATNAHSTLLNNGSASSNKSALGLKNHNNNLRQDSSGSIIATIQHNNALNTANSACDKKNVNRNQCQQKNGHIIQNSKTN